MNTPQQEANEIVMLFDMYYLPPSHVIELCHNHVDSIIEAINSCMLCKQNIRDYWQEVKSSLPQPTRIDDNF